MDQDDHDLPDLPDLPNLAWLDGVGTGRRAGIGHCMSNVDPHDGAGASRGGAEAWIGLAGWIALSLLAGAVGGVASLRAQVFYATLTRPPWAPPGWIFGPVWTSLYLLMGVAAWLVWRARPPREGAAAAARRRGLQLFVVQLALNALWTWLFFAWRKGAWAFGEIALLWLVLVMVTRCFGRVRALAAWCMVPYLGWVLFATALTWAVWRANPGLL